MAGHGSVPSARGELLGDPRRQAVPSISGTVYQAWCSIDAWLKVTNDDQVIYLEGAEDFDVVGGQDGDITVQVKRNEGTISLGTTRAHEALENYWSLVGRDPSRVVHMHYLTTSAVAAERDADFAGQRGIEAWRAARTNPDLATLVARYVGSKLKAGSPLRQFLETADSDALQDRVFSRFHWFADQPDIDVVKSSVEDRLASMLIAQGRPASLARTVRVHLEARFWEVITERQSDLRRLTFGDLQRQVERATTTYLPIRLEQLPDVLSGMAPGLGLLKLLVGKIPNPPAPLLARPELTQRLLTAVDQRRAVLLTGTVFKGKTTIAQLVAMARCPDAWWLSLSERRPDQVDNILRALAGAIDDGDCPGLVVIDDLDIGPAAYRVYGRSLALVQHRAASSGRGVLLTARGATSEGAQLSEFGPVESVEIPELQSDEVRALCVANGCPTDHASVWGLSVYLASRGHPKLVQVRLRELSEAGWPAPGIADLTAPTPATQSARQLARRLLKDSVPDAVASLLYTAAESSILLHRSVLLRLAEYVGISNPGDAVDSVSGKWLECIEAQWYRTTPLLQGAANDVWTPERRQQAHLHIHSAIFLKQTLDPSEAAALLFHGYFGRDWGRVARDALRLQVIKEERARTEVERNLLWLPYVALEPGQPIAGKAETGAPLRALQFRVALTLDAETIPQILSRWAEEVAAVQLEELRTLMNAHMWNAVAISDSRRVPLRGRLDAILGLTTQTGDMAALSAEGTQRFLKGNASHAGIPDSGNTTQLFLALSTRWVRDLTSLQVLVHWLDNDATDEVRADFDSILDWPIVQTMGAFVQGAWAAVHEEISDWQPWLQLFDQLTDYAIRRRSPRIGREAAKAKATILTEHLGDGSKALKVLSDAEATFGRAPVLDEQRANVLFQAKDDDAVLQIWNDLTGRPDARAVLDPFAYRRAGMSAARLGKFAEAAKTLRAGADSVEPNAFAVTRFGLLVDCGLAELLDGRVRDAASTLARAVLGLPSDASKESGERWEPVQRAAAELCRCVDNTLWKPSEARAKIEVGYASSPALKLDKTEPGQEGRTLLLRAQSALIASTHGLQLDGLRAEIDHLAGVPYRFVRWVAAEANLSWHMGQGHAETLLEALIAFDVATSTLVSATRGPSMAFPDETADPVAEAHPENWFGLLVASSWCCGDQLEETLEAWHGKLEGRLRSDGLKSLVAQLSRGASAGGNEAYAVAVDGSKAPAVRCGAAIKALGQALSAAQTLRMEGLLVSAVVSDGSYARQELFNLHLAKRVGASWARLAESPFNFRSPRTTLPALQSAVAEVAAGRGTLRTVLAAANSAAGQPVSEFMSRVY